jgi:hypothetical protein
VARKVYHAHLVELQSVQQLIQLPVFANLLQLHVMLLETVKRQFCLIVHEYFERLKPKKMLYQQFGPRVRVAYVRHEFLACCPNVLR